MREQQKPSVTIEELIIYYTDKITDRRASYAIQITNLESKYRRSTSSPNPERVEALTTLLR